MVNSKTLYQDIIRRIVLNDSKDEVMTMAQLTLEKLFGISRNDMLMEKPVSIARQQTEVLENVIARINKHEPIQYILGEAEFFGRHFIVTPAVLIPRPETEELVREIISIARSGSQILDIGTGSGCIPVTLALEITNATLVATDVSSDALHIAKENALRHDAKVMFMQHDVLKEEFPFTDLDVVVSNPPYIAVAEKEQMKDNVVQYEPHVALFVPDNDPLLFYRIIAAKAKLSLKRGGVLIVEINERFGKEVSNLFNLQGFKEVIVLKDITGKDRMVRGINVD
jgi:release factor glutamine methyltransferase